VFETAKQQKPITVKVGEWRKTQYWILGLIRRVAPKYLEATSGSRFFKKVYSSSELEDISKHAQHVASLCATGALFFCSSMNLTYKRSPSTPT
jgi:hypothetical protein